MARPRPRRLSFERGFGGNHGGLRHGPADDLKPKRKYLGREAARQGDRRVAAEVEGDRKRHETRGLVGRRPQERLQLGERKSGRARSEEHTSELQSLMRISYDVFCLNKKKTRQNKTK